MSDNESHNDTRNNQDDFQQEASISPTDKGLKLGGDVVFATVSSLLKTGISLLKKFDGDLFEIDASGIDHIDSAGVALLLEWQRFCLENHKSCRFTGIHGQGASLIETYKLQHILGLA